MVGVLRNYTFGKHFGPTKHRLPETLLVLSKTKTLREVFLRGAHF
jgi:hypothetical protein